MVERELKHIGMTSAQLLKPEWIDLILKKYGLHTTDDMYAAIGYGGITVNKIMSRLKEEYRLAHKNDVVLQKPVTPQKKRKNTSNGIVVEGIDNCLARLSRCCNPVPGDPIVGYITRGRGVSVHRTDCPNIKAEEKNSADAGRLIPVYWEDEYTGKSSYLTEIQIMAYDRQGLLAQITNVLYDMKILINSVHTKTTKEQIAIMNITIEITSKEQLEQVVKKLSRLGGVFEVTRNNA